jgi:ABC-type multidrug transport system fused ATPase/permease subunit
VVDNKIEPSIYRYVLKHTKKDQVLLLLVTLATMPFVYASLEVPKVIINNAISGQGIPDSILGFPMDQIKFLLALCFLFLALVVITGILKYMTNVYRGVVGERMLRRFRYDLYSRLLRFPLPRFKQVSQGEILPMVTAETEPLGGFIGDAYALPAFQGGLLLTYLFFIFNQDVWLGLAAIALYPPQLYVIPKLQKKVNELAKQRVQAVRKLSDRVGESITGISDIHVNDTSHFEKSRVSSRLGKIYTIRYEIYKRKFFIKFLNNFLGQLTPFFFYAIGGYFVIKRELSLGALVAVLAAYKDLDAPWKELLKFYQITEDIRVKYGQIINQFQPDNMLDPALQEDQESDISFSEAGINASTISYSEDDFVQSLDRVSFSLEKGQHVGVLGVGGSGRGDLTQLLVRLLHPDSGQIKIADTDIASVSEASLGRRISYVDQQSYVFTGTVKENIHYGLKNRLVSEIELQGEEAQLREKEKEFAILSDNSTDDPDGQWINMRDLGFEDESLFESHLIEILHIADLEQDVYQLGLYSSVDIENNPDLAEGILNARNRLRQELQQQEYVKLVELLGHDQYNTNLTVAENLFFGVPLEAGVDFENLVSDPAIAGVLDKVGLRERLFNIGLQTARVLGDMFSDVPDGSPLFERFSFVDSEQLPLLTKLGKLPEGATIETFDADDALFVVNLALKLNVARHRLGLITPEIQQEIVQAHLSLRQEIGDPNDTIEFYSEDKIAAQLPIQDNILFGRVAYGQVNARQKVGELMDRVLDEIGIRGKIIDAGLDYNVGVGGARLNSAQRQKLTIARSLAKNPDILVVNEATSLFDKKVEQLLIKNILGKMESRTVVWVLGNTDYIDSFDTLIVLDKGKILAQGSPSEISANEEILQHLT